MTTHDWARERDGLTQPNDSPMTSICREFRRQGRTLAEIGQQLAMTPANVRYHLAPDKSYRGRDGETQFIEDRVQPFYFNLGFTYQQREAQVSALFFRSDVDLLVFSAELPAPAHFVEAKAKLDSHAIQSGIGQLILLQLQHRSLKITAEYDLAAPKEIWKWDNAVEMGLHDYKINLVLI